MTQWEQKYYDKRGQLLARNLESRHFQACYCANRQDALEKALAWIPEGSSVGWGGALSAQQIGLMDAVKAGPYRAIDRDMAKDPQERERLVRQTLLADVFITGANALSMDGQMVNIDGMGNRLAANAPRYGLNFQENGTTVLLWYLVGALLCGIGPYVAMHFLIKNSNALGVAYNRSIGF